jgi:flagellar protein FlbT
MVNGVVLENGDRRTRLNIVTPDAKVLRLRDAIHPDDANTPVKRVAYIAQLLLAGETEPSTGKRQLLAGIEQLSHVFNDAESRHSLDSATDCAIVDNYYPALKALRSLIGRETRLFRQTQAC